MIYDHIIVSSQKLGAVNAVKNIRGPCDRVNCNKNCTPARAWRPMHCCPIAKLVQHLNGVFIFHNVSRQSIKDRLIQNLKTSIKLAEIKIIFVNLDSYHFLFYGHFLISTFFTKEIQQALIYQDFKQLCDNFNKVIDIVNRHHNKILFLQRISFSDMVIKLSSSLPGEEDLSSKSEEELAALQAEYASLCDGPSIDYY